MSDHVPPAADANPGDLASGFAPGSEIAGYRLEKQVGRGGMAVVFLARDDRLRRHVALKILAPNFAADEAFRQRFIRESLAAAAVEDPHIIPVYEAGEAAGVLFIAMRYVRGGDVRTLLHREGSLSTERTAAIVSPVASALDAAHESGLVHRDVKPANMLVDVRPGRPDHVYLSDFGLSKGALSSIGLTGTGQFLGTPDYCAPEQIAGRLVTGLTDQYSLACAVFEMLTGEPPFVREHGLAVIYAHMSESPPSPTSLRPGLPSAMDRVLARGLAKAPQDRYPTCREFADDLREAAGLPPYAPGPGHAAPAVRPAADHPPTQAAAARPGTAVTQERVIPAGPAHASVPAQPVPAVQPASEPSVLAPLVPVSGQEHPTEPGPAKRGDSTPSAPAESAAPPAKPRIPAEPGSPAQSARDTGRTAPTDEARKWPLRVRSRRPAVVTSVLALAVLLIAGGLFTGYRYTQSQYYIGTDQGQVVVFRGINQSVLGISLSSVYERTGIPLSGVPTNDLAEIRGATIAGGLAQVQRSVATIRNGYRACLAAYANVRQWVLHKPKPRTQTVIRNGRTVVVIVTPSYRPKPSIPSDCPPQPATSSLRSVT